MKTNQLFRTAGAAKTLKAGIFAAALFCSASVFAQVKIGDNPTTIAAGSALEVEATDKGIRLPQVALTSTVVLAPVAGVGTDASSPGMTVYNTNAGITSGTGTNGTLYNSFGAGTYYWDGFGWVGVNSNKGFRLIWAGNKSTVQHFNTGGPMQALNATEFVDDFNAGSSGVFTIPKDAFYTITQSALVSFNGSGTGSWTGFINITPLATGVLQQRTRVGDVLPLSITYGFSGSLTVFLKAGDLVTFAGWGCQAGCGAGNNYDLRVLDQTISIFE